MKLPPLSQSASPSRLDRASLYIREMPGAIEGEGGHNTLFSVSCRLVHGFGLSIEQAMSLLKREYNPRCDPPRTDKELLHKCEQASKAESHEQPREHLVGDVPPWEKEATPEPEPEPAKKSSVFLPGREVLADAVIAIGNREGETIFNCGPDLEGFEIGFGKVTVVGAPPGTGKTSLASQLVFEALRNHPKLNLILANAEMEPSVLVMRELSRAAGVPYHKVRFATYDKEEEIALYDAAKALKPTMDRTGIMTGPYQMTRLIEGLDEQEPGIVVIDYLQKFREGPEMMEGIEQVMGFMRWVAQHGWAVLALSSTARMQGKGGKHDTNQLDMGAFRGSGEIEFQADAAYVLRDQSGGAEGDRAMVLDCVKNRHGARHELNLIFRAASMRFEGEVPANHESSFDDWNQGASF